MTSSPLFLCFTYEYLSAATFSGQTATLQRLGVEEFKGHIPLFFEIKSSSQIYPIRKIIYDHPQGRTVYGNIFEGIDHNAEYILHGKGFPIVNILSDILQSICEKYRQTQGSNNQTPIETFLFLPFDISEKANTKIQKFLRENCGLHILASTTLPEINLPKQQLFVQSLGEQCLWFLYIDHNDTIEPSQILIQTAETVRKIAELVVKRAKKNSSTNIDEQELEKEIAKRELEAPIWIAEAKQKGTCSIHITFKDEYTAMDLLTREDIDKVSLDNTLIINKINQLDKIHSFEKVVLVGENLDNFVLQALLRNEFGGARIAYLRDNEWIEDSYRIVFEDWQKDKKEENLHLLQNKITKIVTENNGELSQTQIEEILAEAKTYQLDLAQIQKFIEAACEKIVFLSFEQIGETTLTSLVKIKHRKLGFVLMKALKEKYTQHADSKNRIKNEFEWLKGKMAHPNIATVLSYSTDENLVYYLSEWLHGNALTQIVMPIQDHKIIQKYALQILAALEILHQYQWYHTRLNEKHIFVETIENQQVIKITNTKIEYAGAAQIEAKQQQNIKEFGLILLQLLTGKNHSQAIAQLDSGDKFLSQWKTIIQQTSGASSGNPYRKVAEITKDIQNLDLEIPPTPPTPIPWKKIFIAITTIIIIGLGIKYGKTALTSIAEKIKPKPEPIAQCMPFKQVFTGVLNKDGKQNLIVALTVFEVYSQSADVCTLHYTLRMDTLEKQPYYERGKTADLFLAQKKIRFEGKLGNVTFDWQQGKLVLKSENFAGLELK